MIAVAYARYSSDNQREESIAAQLHEIGEYAKNNGITIIHTYIDEARTATTDNRPGFLQMVDDAKRGQFQAIVVHKLDRFARDRYDHIHYERKLKLAGVDILSVTERLDDSPESIILKSVIIGMAEYYSKNLARETMKGLNENARHCRHNGGRPPLGLDVEPSTKQYILSANQDEVDAVRLIFDMYVNGFSYGAIISECNLRGYKTKVGQQFGKNSLYEILRNEKYVGTYTYNRSASKDIAGKRNNHKSKDDITRMENVIPALVDKATFEEVQRRMRDKKRNATNKAKVTYLLTGLIFCQCGAAMTGTSSTYKTDDGQNNKLHYYRCGKCSIPKIRKEIVEEKALAELQSEIFSPDKLSVIVQKLNSYNQTESSQLGDALKRYETELKTVKKELDTLATSISKGAPFEPLVDKLNELQGKKELLEWKIAESNTVVEHGTITEEMIKAYLDIHRQALEDKNLDACKKFIKTYVQRVTVDTENITVYLTFTPVLMSGGGGGS